MQQLQTVKCLRDLIGHPNTFYLPKGTVGKKKILENKSIAMNRDIIEKQVLKYYPIPN